MAYDDLNIIQKAMLLRGILTPYDVVVYVCVRRIISLHNYAQYENGVRKRRIARRWDVLMRIYANNYMLADM